MAEDKAKLISATVEKTDEEIKTYQVSEEDLRKLADESVRSAKDTFEKSQKETIKTTVREAVDESRMPLHEIPFEKLSGQQKLDRAKAAAQWVRGMVSKDNVMMHEAYEMCGGERMPLDKYIRAANETTATAGGSSVAPVYFTDLMYQVMKESVAFTKCRNIPVSTNSIYMNTLTTGVTAYYGVSELTAATHTQRVQAQRNIPIYNLRLLSSFSVDLLDDSPRFYAETIALLREAVKYKMDQVVFTLSTPTDGLLSTDLVDSVDNATTYDMQGVSVHATAPTWDELVSILSSIEDEDEEGCEFYIPRSFKFKCLGLKDENLMPVLGSAALTGGFGKFLMGYPVNSSRVLTAVSSLTNGAKFGVFGNLMKTCTLYDRQQLTAKVIDQGTVNGVNMGETGGLGLAMFARFGWDVHVPKYNDGGKTGLTRLVHTTA